MMNIFCKQSRRKWAFTLLMVLLLGLSVALACTGFSAWQSARAQQAEISSRYTTVAVMEQLATDGMDEDTHIAELQKDWAAGKAAEIAPQVAEIDQRLLLSGYIPGSTGLSSCSIEPVEYNIAFEDQCYSLAVLAVECTGIEDFSDLPPEMQSDGHYDVFCNVVEAVSLFPDYDCFPTPDTVRILCNLDWTGGEILFQVGKTYLIFGQYHDHPVLPANQSSTDAEGEAGYRQKTSYPRYFYPLPRIDRFDFRPLSGLTSVKTMPWVAEYTGDLGEFWESEAGAYWREEILPICQLNYASATVILTDNLNSMYAFNTGETSLLEGRFFTAEEYRSGAPVCMVSAAYAQVNGLQLGDTLPIQLYRTSYELYGNGGRLNTMFDHPDPGPYIQRNFMLPEEATGLTGEYTIVGIYTGPRFSFGLYTITADTIFLPKAAVPNAGDYTIPGDTSPRLCSYILKNGTAEAFEAYMADQGLGGMFLYFDQDYTAMAESLAAMSANALRLFAVGLGAFLLISALFLFLNFRRMGPVIRGARLLGRPVRVVRREMIGLLFCLEGAAVLLGGVLSAVLFDAVTRATLSSALTLQVDGLLIMAAVLLGLLFAASCLWATIAARQKLMQSK